MPAPGRGTTAAGPAALLAARDGLAVAGTRGRLAAPARRALARSGDLAGRGPVDRGRRDRADRRPGLAAPLGGGRVRGAERRRPGVLEHARVDAAVRAHLVPGVPDGRPVGGPAGARAPGGGAGRAHARPG